MNRLFRKSLLVLAALAVCSAASLTVAQERGPSTPEERANVVALARYLEQEPLGKKAKDARAELIVWWVSVPDLTVSLCSEFLGPVAGSKHKYAAEIVTQMMFSTGAYLIEHPGTDPESVEAYGAGVEGALRAYEAILKAKPKLRDAFLDDLLAKRDAGGLATFVSQTIPKCKP